MSFLHKNFLACCNPPVTVDEYDLTPAQYEPFAKDDHLWHVSLTDCSTGSVSCATVSANDVVEDHSEVQSGPHGTFLAVYDGHGGPQAAEFLRDRLFLHYEKTTPARLPGPLLSSLALCEEEFLSLVRASWRSQPGLASVGSCALLGAISLRGPPPEKAPELHVASLGDSRAVLGCQSGGKHGSIIAVQLSTDHNANYSAIRQELTSRHSDEKDIVVQRGGVWRVKGIIQVSRAIGDFYLKSQEFQAEPLLPKFRLPEPLRRPALSSEPSTLFRALSPNSDKFAIFASDGLWEYLSNQEAVELVHKYPREGIAQRLVTVALMRAASKKGVTYGQLKELKGGRRRAFHDDISVVVHFFDFGKMARSFSEGGGGGARVAIRAGEEFTGKKSGTAEKDEEMEKTPLQGLQWRHSMEI